ncbi:response regulator [Yinghuangia sp. ASG 101]|uniref:response regulator n=1 Tax=Yinghuangia sp. ASG 101 TaxID=2896848 RepID=UPI001E5B3CF9|nr:response regulator [Yinghuangia sp. ASG 101]UGQ13472.1 response regulator [Yinghuangia sp. ASG 101]
MLDVSVRGYGARRFRDAGSISRFLSGARVPPWQFVVELLDDVARCRGEAEAPEAVAHLRRLHGAAFHHVGAATGSAKVLELQLAEAELDARRSSVDEELLGGALVDRNHRIAELEARLTQLEGTWSGAVRSPQHTVLESEREALAMQVRSLSDELETTRRRGLEAEARCDTLERQLAVLTRPEPDPPPSVDAVPPKILIVDDQPNNLFVLEEVVAAPGHEIVSARSGKEALKALLAHDDFALIILDVQMPEMDGYETAAHIKRRSRTRDIPIIFLTAMAVDAEHSIRGYSAGAVDYIVKPFDLWALRAKIAVFIDLHAERRARGRTA